MFGFGHLTRCISLAESFKSLSYEIEFIINADESVNNILYNYNYEFIDWNNNNDLLIKKLSQTSLILIDSLYVQSIFIKKLEKLEIPIILFDDEKRTNILNKGFVIDWTVLSEKSNYFLFRKKEVTYFLGAKYATLRSEFSTSARIEVQKKINSVFISFGGSDVRNMTPKILNFLNKHYPFIQKNIVIGPGFNKIEEIKKYEDSNTTLFYNLSCSEMIECMKNSDIAISAGGQTLYELARISLPTIAVLLVENAKDDTLGWQKVGFLEYIGEYDDDKLLNNLDSSMKKIQSYEKRKEMFLSVNDYIDFEKKDVLVKEIIGKLNVVV